MRRITTPVSMILGLLLCIAPGPLRSQAQVPSSPEQLQQQHREQMQADSERRAQEGSDRMRKNQEEFWERVDRQDKERLEKSLESAGDQEKQRLLESWQKRQEGNEKMRQHLREFWQRAEDSRRQQKERMEEERRRHEEEQKLIRKVVNEYADEVWQEVLGVTVAQWKTLKPLLERIHQLKDTPCVDISVYWIAGSGGFQEESLVESPDGTRSVARAFGWFSVTSGAGSIAESSTRANADAKDGIPPMDGGHNSGRFGSLTSGQYSATARTGAIPEDPNQPVDRYVVRRTGGEPRRAVAGGAIKYSMQLPGPVRKQVGDIALGWLWERPALGSGPDALSESEKACERLVEVFEIKDADPNEVRARVAALRQVRARRQAELREAQEQLRALITPAQESRLILLGYLD